jgi:sugar porter (SP) family MFS transporter
MTVHFLQRSRSLLTNCPGVLTFIEHMRGRLGTLWQIAVTLGILIASACNIGLQKWDEGWRLSYGGNILFSLVLLGCLAFMPESPRWLAANGSDEELMAALKKTRFEEDIEHEVAELQEETAEEKNEGKARWKEVFSKKNNMLYRVLLGMSLQLFQQLSGINAIMFYAPDILNTFFTQEQSVIGTFVLNVINFLSTFITVWAIDRFGRVKLLASGGLIMLGALIANAILAAQPQTIEIGYIVIVFSALFIVGFAYSWGPVVWVVCSEMFPLRHRGKATGLSTATNWVATTLVGALFPAASTASLSGCFTFFAVMIACGTLVVHFFEVETANKTILEIDEAFADHKPRLRRWKYAAPKDKDPLKYSAGSITGLKTNEVPAFDEEEANANPEK